MDWLEFGNRFGIPLLILAAAAWFIVRYVWPFIVDKIWPFIVKQIEDFKKEREVERGQFLASIEMLTRERQAERMAFLAALDARDKQFAPMVESIDKLHDTLTDRMDNLTAALNQIDKRRR